MLAQIILWGICILLAAFILALVWSGLGKK